MAQYEEPEFDVDAFQAQVNMAMAETEELVSSWVQPSKNINRRPKQSLEAMEKELQQYLRRPPRLGVGAPIPEPVGPTAQEEAKLKAKLTGRDTKKSHDGEASRNPEDEVEDEDVKKGESSMKRIRHDPFAVSKKKARRNDDIGKVAVDGVINPSPAPPILNGVSRVVVESPREAESGPVPTSNTQADSGLESPVSQSSTKKKRNKKRKLEQPNGIAEIASDSTTHPNSVDGIAHEGSSTNNVRNEEPGTKDEDDEWTGFRDEALDGLDLVQDEEHMNDGSSLQTDGTSLILRTGPPLLNLNGPPQLNGENGDVGRPSSKKKRRRRKKNKANGMDNTASS